MAKATVVEETPIPPPKRVLLELSWEEASWVAGVLRHVDYTTLARAEINVNAEIYAALRLAGVPSANPSPLRFAQ